MKINDFIFRFPGTRNGICRVRTFASHEIGIAIVLTDLEEKNPGRSTSNAIELICGALIGQGFMNTDALIIQHFESPVFGSPFLLVQFSSEGQPKWTPITIEDAMRLTGCTQRELEIPTLEIHRLSDEIERLRNSIDPFGDSPYPEDPNVVKRRREITSTMISKVDLLALVGAGAGERALQAMIKKDLSLIAEVYAKPDEEYICFSEFPVGSGVVDFAVFTGCSQMDVILIEIKGANFPFLTKNSYGSLSAKINEAAQQIRRRVGFVYDDYATFRKYVHGVREAVESGEKRHNSFLGPQVPLQVDPDKEVVIRCVVIGGRRVNDLTESRIRYEYENDSVQSVKLESWNSWLGKLRRE